MDAKERAAFAAAFGARQTKTVPIALQNGEAVPVVLRELDGAEDARIQATVGALPSQEEKDGAWVRCTIAARIERWNGQPFPDAWEDRVSVVELFTESVLVQLARAVTDFANELNGLVTFVASHPNSSGATAGSSSGSAIGGGRDPSAA